MGATPNNGAGQAVSRNQQGKSERERLRSIRDPLPLPNELKTRAWDAYRRSRSPEDFKRQFDALGIPQEAKASLWDAKFSTATTVAPEVQEPQPVGPSLLERVKGFVRAERPRSLIGRVAGQAALRPPPEAKPLEAARMPLIPLTKLLPEGPPTATVSLPRYPSRFGPRVAPPGQGVRAGETVDFPIGGAARGAVEIAESLTPPANIALIASIGLTGGAFPIVSRLISAGFSVDLIRGAVQEYPELREAMNAGDEQRVAQVATRMGLSGLLGALAGRHAVRGRTAAGEV
ncbi:hypothetical protein LCGC14_2425230, partial [marine sediment metagenome]